MRCNFLLLGMKPQAKPITFPVIVCCIKPPVTLIAPTDPRDPFQELLCSGKVIIKLQTLLEFKITLLPLLGPVEGRKGWGVVWHLSFFFSSFSLFFLQARRRSKESRESYFCLLGEYGKLSMDSIPLPRKRTSLPGILVPPTYFTSLQMTIG